MFCSFLQSVGCYPGLNAKKVKWLLSIYLFYVCFFLGNLCKQRLLIRFVLILLHALVKYNVTPRHFIIEISNREGFIL